MIYDMLFLIEEILSVICLNEKLVEYVSASLRRFLHADASYHALRARLGGECSDCFLCHNLCLLYYFISR